MNTQELRMHALRRLYELAEGKGYNSYFSLDEIAAEVGVGDRMKVLRLGEALETDGLIALSVAHDRTGASIKMRGVQTVEEGLLSPEPTRVPVNSIGMPVPEQRNENMQVFISHSSQDEVVAKRLVALLRAALNLPPSEIRCTSVDGYRLEVGADTGSQLRRELIEARSFIGIISKSSMNSAWVLFELGARWGAEKHLAPVLAPGVQVELLKGPLSGLNALSCSSSAQLHQLIVDIGRHLGITPNSPAVYQEQIDELANMPGHSLGDVAKTYEAQGSPPSGPDFLLRFRRKVLTQLRDGDEGELTLDLRREVEGSPISISALKVDLHRLADEERIVIIDEGPDLMVVREPQRFLEGHLLD